MRFRLIWLITAVALVAVLLGVGTGWWRAREERRAALARVMTRQALIRAIGPGNGSWRVGLPPGSPEESRRARLMLEEAEASLRVEQAESTRRTR
jgi:hypothetical protein